MTPSELKSHVLARNSDSHFFDRKTMAFFGDSMSNYGVKSATVETHYDDSPVDVWELYRKKPVKHGLKDSAYWRKDTFEQVRAKKER